MSNFAGALPNSIITLPGGGSAQLSAFATTPATLFFGISRASDLNSGAEAYHQGIMVPRALGGNLEPMFGGELFGKVIVAPRLKALGYLLGAQIFTVDVWNTHGDVVRVIASVIINGTGGLQLTGGTPPIVLAPFSDSQFTATMPQHGDPIINDDAVFSVPNETGTDCLVTGTRLVIFPFDPDWNDPVLEDTEFLTGLLNSYGDTEQRWTLRKHPRTRLAFKVLTIDQRQTNSLEALIIGWQAGIFGVPFWPDVQALQVALTSSSTVLQVPTTLQTKFAVGGLVMLWRDPYTAAAFTIQSVTATSITLTAPVGASWAADGQTFVVPILTGRLGDNAELKRISSINADFTAEFECEVI